MLTLKSATALVTPTVLSIPFGSFNFAGSYYEFQANAGSLVGFPALRPSTDYAIDTALQTDGVPPTLEAYGSLAPTQRLDAGANAFTLDVQVTGQIGSAVAAHTSATAQVHPAAAFNKDTGEFLVVWQEGGDVLDGRFDKDGMAKNTAVVVNTSPGGASQPVVAYNSVSQRYLIAWSDTRGGQAQIYACYVDGTGLPDPSDHQVEATGSNQTEPCIASARDGVDDLFLLVWTDDLNGNPDLYARRVNSDVSPFDVSVIPLAVDVGSQSAAAAVWATTADRFVVAYQEGGDVAYKMVRTGDGSVLPGGPVTGQPASSTRDQPALAYNSGTGMAMVAWHDDRGGGQAVYYAVLDPAGSGGVVVPETALGGSGNQSSPRVRCGSVRDDYLVAYDRAATGPQDVNVRRIKSDGTSQYGDKQLVNDSADQLLGGVAYDSADDEFLAAYEDDAGLAAVKLQVFR